MKSAGGHLLSASALADDQNAAVNGRGIGNALLEVQEDLGFTNIAVVISCHVVKFTIVGEKCQDLQALYIQKRAKTVEFGLGTGLAM